MVNPNGSEAYDLSLFEPREPKLVALKPNKKAVKEARRHARIQSFLNTALTLLTAAAVVVLPMPISPAANRRYPLPLSSSARASI